MAQLRQSGTERVAGRSTLDFLHGDGGGDGGADQVSIRIPQRHGGGRTRRPGQKGGGQRRVSVFAIAMILALTLLISVSVLHFLFRDRESGSDLRPRLNRSMAFKELRFGKGSTMVGGDSRYWDRDDRRRDEEYDEDSSELSNAAADEEGRRTEEVSAAGEEQEGAFDHKKSSGRGLYNEAGRTELKEYEEMFEESLKRSNESAEEGNPGEETSSGDEYDDGFEMEEVEPENGGGRPHDHDSGHPPRVSSRQGIKLSSKNKASKSATGNARTGLQVLKSSRSGKKTSGARGSPKRRRFSGCEMKFLNSTDLLVEPLENKKFSRFSLQYTDVEERPSRVDGWEPRFSGHQSLQEREKSFYVRDQKLNCGFVKGPKGSPSTGFDLAEDDAKFMASCHIAVSSCIFGNSDRLRAPNNRMIKRSSRKHVCFVMFVDEITLKTLSDEGQKPDGMGFFGLWKIVLVKNLPFTDMRRVGKIPKFLSHRLFPTARYSIWLDSKLRLNSDPQLLLEYFLWRKGYEYAISNHYDRHCVWDEVMQNKKLNKYNHTVIDQQFAFYQADGLRKFNASDPNKLLPSYVPEGSFIMRAHTPMSNLFSCLWFNEVDRFTPRDQLSFAYTYLKLKRMNPDKPFYLNMFKDCERRAIAKLYHHRGEDKRTPALEEG
ncbi:unnamed protein product [Spirodela intermedia]|uniref:TOD1/MUCI70 glycosyltransferase-like domain-containing protein n=1 Tax=Spirodela intermedia TaxID=51605 RepID=A0A7I8JI16_SPIIN|nr:unnamed protein product [Spirodela intermedia]CAA6669760.1 unnamed protein product [Spirodela intermedia]